MASFFSSVIAAGVKLFPTWFEGKCLTKFVNYSGDFGTSKDIHFAVDLVIDGRDRLNWAAICRRCWLSPEVPCFVEQRLAPLPPTFTVAMGKADATMGNRRPASDWPSPWGSLKPPLSLGVLLLTMLGGRAPRPAAGIWKQMLETFLRCLMTCWSASLSSERPAESVVTGFYYIRPSHHQKRTCPVPGSSTKPPRQHWCCLAAARWHLLPVSPVDVVRRSEHQNRQGGRDDLSGAFLVPFCNTFWCASLTLLFPSKRPDVRACRNTSATWKTKTSMAWTSAKMSPRTNNEFRRKPVAFKRKNTKMAAKLPKGRRLPLLPRLASNDYSVFFSKLNE